MQIVRILLVLIGGILLLGSVAANLILRIFFRSKAETDLDDWYYEFEDQHPGLQRYNKLISVTHCLMAIGALLLFAVAAI